MKHVILTGTPGSGKTTLINALEARGYAVVKEAATDVITEAQRNGIARPWEEADFIDKVTLCQKERQETAYRANSPITFYDRSPICTLALAQYLNQPTPVTLKNEISRIQQQVIYCKDVFLIENLGFISNTDVRQISFEEALRFETIHKQAYEQLGYRLVSVKKNILEERVEKIVKEVLLFGGSPSRT